jgi:hypothetical protein
MFICDSFPRYPSPSSVSPLANLEPSIAALSPASNLLKFFALGISLPNHRKDPRFVAICFIFTQIANNYSF